MKAMVIEKFGDVDEMHFAEVPKPMPKDNEVQIQVMFCGVNPVDWKICEGYLKDRVPHQFPIILGWDVAGIVTEVGKNVKKFKQGDKVFAYCRKPTIHSGTYAEFICFDAEHIARKPENMSFAQAASTPLAALTAWQSLFDAAKLKKGDTILIHAGAGGVGGFAIEFAKHCGATVITTASQANHDYVKKLGAEHVIDYKKADFAIEIKKWFPQGIDVVFDTIGGQVFQKSIPLLKPKGHLVSILEKLDPKIAKEKNIQFDYVFVAPNGKELEEIAKLIQDGRIAPLLVEEFALKDAKKLMRKLRKATLEEKSF